MPEPGPNQMSAANALAESFVDSYKTELIADRVWRTRTELELATVEWVAWFNTARLRSSLGDVPPIEFEALNSPKPVNRSVATIPSRTAELLTTRRPSANSDTRPASPHNPKRLTPSGLAIPYGPAYGPVGVDLRSRGILAGFW